MKKTISQRMAQDDYHAHLIAQGMENAGADVFAITSSHAGYIQVYCKHDSFLGEETIDSEIKKILEIKAENYLFF